MGGKQRDLQMSFVEIHILNFTHEEKKRRAIFTRVKKKLNFFS